MSNILIYEFIKGFGITTLAIIFGYFMGKNSRKPIEKQVSVVKPIYKPIIQIEEEQKEDELYNAVVAAENKEGALRAQKKNYISDIKHLKVAVEDQKNKTNEYKFKILELQKKKRQL